MNRIKWTQYQIDLLIKLYSDCENVKDLTLTIGRDEKSIYSKAFELKIKRNQNPGNKNLLNFGEKYRFKKGFTPWNKGLKGLNIGGEKTQFKKGHIPLNTKFFGKPYLVTRKFFGKIDKFWAIEELGSSKRQLYNRWLWEQEKGKIPKDCIVYYLNGVNSLNPPKIEDLGLMTLRENMERNSIQRLDPEIKKTVKLLNKLIKMTKNETD